MSKTLEHEKWDHQHEDQLMKMTNSIQVRLTVEMKQHANMHELKVGPRKT